MQRPSSLSWLSLAAASSILLALAACEDGNPSGSSSSTSTSSSTSSSTSTSTSTGTSAGGGGTGGQGGVGGDAGAGGEVIVPAPPPDLGFTDSAPEPVVSAAFVDSYQGNIGANATPETNPVLALFPGFDKLWKRGATWDTGVVVDAEVLTSNVKYVVDVTQGRSAVQEVEAYIDDRRNQNYSVMDGLGPLADPFKEGIGASTTITGIPLDATTTKYDDAGSWCTAGSPLEGVAALVSTLRGNFSSTTPAKNYFVYPRPWRLNDNSVVEATEMTDALGFPIYSSNVAVVPALLPVRGMTPATDGGFPSGHTNAGWLASLAIAYAVPERFQEMMARAAALGEARILAGMHSPLDVMGGRVMATALAAAILADPANAEVKNNAYEQAHLYLEEKTGTTVDTLYAYAHSENVATDPFADRAQNAASYNKRLTYGFAPDHTVEIAMVVPRGAEVLLETRFPYLDAQARRVVLRTTGLPSGYPLLDDPEGWGRLNLFAAADGYGSFAGDVILSMDSALGGFSARDAFRNDISGSGKLTKRGTGTLVLSGENTYSGGTVIEGGSIVSSSTHALGSGDVVVTGGALINESPGGLQLGARYTQLADGSLELGLGGSGQGRLVVSGVVTIAGGALHLKFPGDIKPSVGDTLAIISGSSFAGKFDSITADGFAVSPTYTATGLDIRFDAVQ